VELFRIFHEVGLPAGTANLVLGTGPAAGHELALSHDVDMITFTGSTRTGQIIASAAVGNLKKVGLELGGKSPNIIFADADLEGAVEWAMIGVFFNQGEVCSAGSRILVEESLKERFVARFAERANAMTIGDGLTRSSATSPVPGSRARAWCAAASATPRANAPRASSCAPRYSTIAAPTWTSCARRCSARW